MTKGFSQGDQPPAGGRWLPRVGRSAIMDTMSYLALPRREYVILGRASLVVRGIRPNATDLELLVSDEVFSGIVLQEEGVRHDSSGLALESRTTTSLVKVLESGTCMPVSVATRVDHGKYPMTLESHGRYADIISGLSCLSLKQVVQCKVALGNDLRNDEDLAAIVRFQGRPIDWSEFTATSARTGYD